jgi:glycosyltransferase involved in cell wall biosynthesis
MSKHHEHLKVLHIVLSIGETNATYNEHCLPMAEQRDITICTYFKAQVTPPKSITLFEGNGSPNGFFHILRDALEAKQYDIVHVHSPHVGLLFLLATVFRRRKFSSLTVATVHDSYPNYKLRNQLLFLPVFARFEKVICCGRASYESFPAFYKWLAKDRLCFVQNGLDISRVDGISNQVAKQPASRNEFVLIGVSRLVEIKNPFTVLRAFQQSANPESRLVMIGEGPLRQALVTQTREAGLADRTAITGLIPREQVFEHLLGADVFISASRGEGLPVAVLEAMASSCPVVLSDIPPHREIAEGVDFIPLIPADDVNGFAGQIKRFREMSAPERAVIGEKCRKLVEERFSLDAMHARYEEIYTRATDNSNHPLLEIAR